MLLWAILGMPPDKLPSWETKATHSRRIAKVSKIFDTSCSFVFVVCDAPGASTRAFFVLVSSSGDGTPDNGYFALQVPLRTMPYPAVKAQRGPSSKSPLRCMASACAWKASDEVFPLTGYLLLKPDLTPRAF